MFIELLRFLQDMASGVLFLSFSLSLLHFLLTHFVPTYETISTSAYNGRSETTRYQMCKAQAIINELASIGKVITKVGWLTKECKWRKNREVFIPYFGDLQPYSGFRACS